jgi:thioredoxin 1
MSSNSEDVLRLNIPELLDLIRGSTWPIVVDVVGEHCPPCQLLRPLLRKLAIEFASRMTVVEIDSANCKGLPFDIEAIPTLLLFKDGKHVNTERGFESLERTTELITTFLGVPTDGSPSPAERAFRDAHREALGRQEATQARASEAIEPYFRAIEPEWQQILTNIERQVETGQSTRGEATRLKASEWTRLSAPFADKAQVFSKAQAAAFDAYRELMDLAVEGFGAALPAPAAKQQRGAFCRPGDPFCELPASGTPRAEPARGSTAGDGA